MLLDVALNIRSFYSSDYVTETVEILTGKERGEVNESWNDLAKTGIVFQKDYQWFIDQARREEIKKSLEENFSEIGITADRITDIIEEKIQINPEKLSIYVKLLSKIYKSEGKKYIIFSDGEWISDIGDLCEELLKERIVFRYSSSSRKHSYRNFYLRVWPFDVEEIINKIVLKHLNVEGLSDEEWQVISLLLLSRDLSHEYQTIKNNVGFTDPELRELITCLKERGLVEEKYGRITLLQGLKESLIQYYKLTFYPKLKSEVISRIKQRIGRSMSALWLFTMAGRIYNLPIGEIRTEPILSKAINRTEVKEFEHQLTDIKDLGILYDFGDSVLLVGDTMRDVENWLKGSIRQSLVFIPARDYYLARSIFKDIFSKCQEHVKIQDAYLGEETFDLLEYIPPELRIQILTGIKLGEGEDPMRIFHRIDRLNAERRGKFQILFIGDRTTGDAPFHDRFILSKTRGWQVGTSLKQVGKGKDTTVSEVSKVEKDERVEPVFDRWWNVKISELEPRNKIKMNYQEWKDHITRVSET